MRAPSGVGCFGAARGGPTPASTGPVMPSYHEPPGAAGATPIRRLPLGRPFKLYMYIIRTPLYSNSQTRHCQAPGPRRARVLAMIHRLPLRRPGRMRSRGKCQYIMMHAAMGNLKEFATSRGTDLSKPGISITQKQLQAILKLLAMDVKKEVEHKVEQLKGKVSGAVERHNKTRALILHSCSHCRRVCRFSKVARIRSSHISFCSLEASIAFLPTFSNFLIACPHFSPAAHDIVFV